ncbi:hypothetical protein Dsin_005856 [Dipteronia sinensis]|uniref:Uncharacterized protein n=1 Tax=Dipteronia sinensis TaxID=43782 RepID=A0AAE0AYN6_9ROSI|nr:hypothetical protein Dsin_005856 [Dipteronia sinensis]
MNQASKLASSIEFNLLTVDIKLLTVELSRLTTILFILGVETGVVDGVQPANGVAQQADSRAQADGPVGGAGLENHIVCDICNDLEVLVLAIHIGRGDGPFDVAQPVDGGA